jgi:hypothetical protein
MATQWHSWHGLGPRSVAVHRAGDVVLTAVGAQARTADTLHPAEMAVLAQRPEAGRADFVVGRRAARLCLRTLGVGGPVLGTPGVAGVPSALTWNRSASSPWPIPGISARQARRRGSGPLGQGPAPCG